MGLRIFETDPEAAPQDRQRFSEDIVGRFRSGYQINGRPSSLEKWRVTSGDPEVADRIVELFGSENDQAPQSWETKGEDNLEVFTTSEAVKVILDGPDALKQEMILWGRNNNAIRRCDGIEQKGVDKDDPAKGKGCECPQLLADRKDAAKKGTGCQPSITAYFRLADDPELGRFRFTSGSWSLVKDIVDFEKKLAKVNGPALVSLGLEVVEYGEGRDKKRFIKPVFELLGAYKPKARPGDEEPPY
ncbi:hypothetical protein [Micromonospora sp. NPDC047730]|uniref:recombination directionality factor n=1 Tax=Micromonospora sp. NPDC047730 TaxID=3364253 RepID=UPI0037225A4D